tara:strand:+ start:825 stop:1037 length:213 start_codon:yes stop_codon:yes gene_type:complete
MSEAFDKAFDILGKEKDLDVEDYNLFKELQKKIDKSEIRNFSRLNDALFQRLPEIAKSFGSYDFLEDEDK